MVEVAGKVFVLTELLERIHPKELIRNRLDVYPGPFDLPISNA